MRFKLVSLLVIIVLVTAAGPIYGANLKFEGELVSNLEVSTEESEINLWENYFTLKLNKYSSNSGLLTASLEVNDRAKEVTLQEAFAEIYFPAFDVKVGKQEIAWGKTDGVNPTDYFSPTDYTDPAADEDKLAVKAARVKYYYGDWIIDSVWVPEFSEAKLPEEGDYWHLPQFAGIKAAKEPETKLYNSEYGIRLSRWSRFIDFSLSYYRGWSRLPVVLSTGQVKYSRKQALGTAFAKDFGQFVLRGEGAYSILEDTKDRVDYVLGLDTNATDNLYLNTQLIGERIEDKEDPEHQTAVSIQYDLTSFKQLELNGIYELDGDGYLVNPQFNYDLKDGVNLFIGGYIFAGDQKESRLGKLADKDYVFAKLTRSF